jgi:MFS superfamily sulfate permease-like transporter
MVITPKTGFKGLIENWQSDLSAAVSVALVALPLALGIAVGSGFPPISGVITAIVGGVVTTFIKSGHVSINGPSAGQIAVLLAAFLTLDDGSGKTIQYITAAVVISGGLQALLGIIRLGKFADIFHSTVIQGILAAIGIIIFASELPYSLGLHGKHSEDVFSIFQDIGANLHHINPFVVLISLTGLFILIFHSRISFKLFHIVPAPIWVLMLSIPFVFAFNFFEPHSINLFGRTFQVGPDLLISIPENITESLILPDFSKINTLPFWTTVISITLVSCIESLASAKAIDKMDPYNRKTNMNKDLIGIGIATMISGGLGGLPIVNKIILSTVNVHNRAKTKWSNFYHGVILLAFIFVLAPVIQMIPYAALAVLLVFTGFKLTSPKVFRTIYRSGTEQLIFFIGTILITLNYGIILGILGGLLIVLIFHVLIAKVPISRFFKLLYKVESKVTQGNNGSYVLHLKGIVNFLYTLKINNLLDSVPEEAPLEIDLSESRLVDYSIMEHIHDVQRSRSGTHGELTLLGSDEHIALSDNDFSLRIQTSHLHKSTAREKKLQLISEELSMEFNPNKSNKVEYYQTFYFFKSRPIDIKYNELFSARYQFNICDVLFEEGGIVIPEEFRTTLGLIKFNTRLPKFTIERKSLTERYLKFTSPKDIDYEIYEDFPDKFLVKVEDPREMRSFATEDLKKLIDESKVIHHLECNGEAILLFTDNLRLAHVKNYPDIATFAKELHQIVGRRRFG